MSSFVPVRNAIVDIECVCLDIQALQLKQQIKKPNMKKLHVVYIEKRKLLHDIDESYHMLRHWTKIKDSLHSGGNKTLKKGKSTDTSDKKTNDPDENENKVELMIEDE
jgi:hypothetical protein